MHTGVLQGIELDCSGTCQRFYGSLIAFLGDTPAAGLVGGFKEGVGAATRGCRSCMIKIDELSTKVSSLTIVRVPHYN